METRAVIDLTADRQVYYYDTFAWIGHDFTAADFDMHIRAVKDTGGSALISLAKVTTFVEGVRLLYAGTATISAHIAAGRLLEVPEGYSSGDSVLLSQISILIADTSIRDLPFPSERGDDAVFWYDLIVEGAVTVPVFDAVFMAGKFIVRAGVTVP